MGTLSSELASHAARLAGQPRVYADANLPSGVITFMRTHLQWDVLFVVEHDDLRRASDGAHFRLACQLQRTLVTLDRDYLDDRRFPPAEGSGVLVISAPNEQGLARILERIDQALFRPAAAAEPAGPLPLVGRKVHAHVDWTPESRG